MITMYGIANCDTIKKAKKWLESENITYQFHDYKKLGVETEFLQQQLEIHGLDKIVNKRGTTYRKLTEEQKNNLNTDTAVELLSQNTSMIKRPIIIKGELSLLGFSTASYEEFFKSE